MSSERSAVVFDWDGVIADSVAMFFDVYVKTFAHFKRHLPVQSVDEFRGWYKARWEQNFSDCGFSPPEVEAALDFARGHIDYANVGLFPEVVEAIRRFARIRPVGIASTTGADLIRGRLRKAELLECFGTVVGGEEGGSDKVKRFGDAVRLLDVDPRRSVAVGDTPLDIHCARHWGMATVGVTYGWNHDPIVRAANPDRLVAHPSEVEGAVNDLLGR